MSYHIKASGKLQLSLILRVIVQVFLITYFSFESESFLIRLQLGILFERLEVYLQYSSKNLYIRVGYDKFTKIIFNCTFSIRSILTHFLNTRTYKVVGIPQDFLIISRKFSMCFYQLLAKFI